MDVDVADDALLVDDDDGALADSLVLFPDAVFLRHFALGMEVGEKRIVFDSAEGFCKRYVAGNAVNRYAHDLGIIPFKVGHFGLISRHLHGSDRGPVERVKHEYYVLLAAVVAELELLTAAMAGKLEVWGCIADFERLGPIRGGRSSNTDCHARSSLRVM